MTTKSSRDGGPGLITGSNLKSLINSGELGQVFAQPLLEESQIGAVSVDVRLGCDFLVSVQSRHPSVQLAPNAAESAPDTFFQPTRRDIGDKFLIHPSQTVLAVTLEYIGLPEDVFAELISRSSYARLGIGIWSSFQPGYRGCLSMEISNHSNVPVELIVGSRIAQARFQRVAAPQPYIREGERRKYVAHVRPEVSRADWDQDLEILNRIGRAYDPDKNTET